jgi:hypothetical protein
MGLSLKPLREAIRRPVHEREVIQSGESGAIKSNQQLVVTLRDQLFEAIVGAVHDAS